MPNCVGFILSASAYCKIIDLAEEQSAATIDVAITRARLMFGESKVNLFKYFVDKFLP